MSLLKSVVNRVGSVSWRHPAVAAILPAIDVVDSAVRRRHGLAELTPYSARIRATGVEREFGGRKFASGGRVVADMLGSVADLKSTDRVLEVGCGAGRTAFALLNVLEDGNFVGMDIDWPQIAACRANSALAEHDFRFIFLDVESDMYNPRGAEQASSLRFPFADGEFDVVFLMSVFTHMFPSECENYAREIMRVLAPGGRAVVSAFLHDVEWATQFWTFSHQQGDMWIQFPTNPRKAVSQDQQVLERWFGQPADRRVLGNWRRSEPAAGHDYQDWLIWVKHGDS